MQTTRRGFLKGGVLGTAAVAACAQPPRGQASSHPDAEPATAPEPGLVTLRTTVNGQSQQLEIGPDESTLELVRERLGLTGCKLGCGHGACGACTMQLDGAPVASCLLPGTAVEGRRLTTIEGLTGGATGGGADQLRQLHPIQRAFMAEDALQCGYCTPGFVVEAAAFHDRWRAEHGTEAPSRDEVAAALAGHFCRCGAYPAIFRAVIGACTGRFDELPEAGPASPRVEALAKVTGAAKYTVDVAPDGVLIAKVLRSPHAHATVRAIDWAPALAHPGVFGAIELTKPGHKVRFVGQEVVALAAIDAATARAALTKVRVDYEVLPAVVGREAALAPDAALVYAGNTRKKAPNENEMPLLPERWSGNVRGPFELFSHQPGAARRRLEAASARDKVSARFETQVQVHTALEPHAAVAEWLADDRLRVHVSTQAVRHLAEAFAHRYKLRPDRVEVLAEHVGGGFGSKAVVPIEAIAAIELARVCGRPVKLVNDRREEIAVGGSRPSLLAELSLADDEPDGPPAMVVTGKSDAGVAVGSAACVMIRIHYPQAALDLRDYDVLNHAPPGTPFRGPGGPPAYFAVEQAVDMLARQRDEDPLALRRRWNQNENRERVFAWAEALPLWRDRARGRRETGRYRRGIGLASASWFYFTEPATRVQIDAGPAGIVISTATQDMGNGSRTVLADAVAGVLGVHPRDLEVRIGGSKAVHGPTSGGSRTATSLGPAAIEAALELRDELVELAQTRLGLRDAVAVAGGVMHAGAITPWAEILAVAPTITTTGKRGRDQGGFFLPPVADTATGRYLSAAVHVTEVEVDTRLGRVRVVRSHAGYSVGTIYSPTLARSQAEGGIVQGIGYALYEERRLDPRHGTLLTGGLEDYRLPGLADVGEIAVEFLPGGFDKVRGQGIGLAELCTLPVAAAIANAVHDATGWRPTQLPIRPDRTLAGVRS